MGPLELGVERRLRDGVDEQDVDPTGDQVADLRVLRRDVVVGVRDEQFLDVVTLRDGVLQLGDHLARHELPTNPVGQADGVRPLTGLDHVLAVLRRRRGRPGGCADAANGGEQGAGRQDRPAQRGGLLWLNSNSSRHVLLSGRTSAIAGALLTESPVVHLYGHSSVWCTVSWPSAGRPVKARNLPDERNLVVDKPNERDAKSAVRTIQILERLAEGDAPTLAELARDLDAPKSSLHVVVQTLIRRGWVQRDAAGRLAIGVRAVRVGTAYVDGDPVVALTAPVLDALGRRARRDGAPRSSRRNRHRVPRQARVDPAAAPVLGRRAPAPGVHHGTRQGDPGRAARRQARRTPS